MTVTPDGDGGKVGAQTELEHPVLLAHHREDLRRSGLTDEQMRACGFYSAADPAEVAAVLGWRRSAEALGSCLAIPYPAADGSPTDYVRLKPDRPRAAANGRPIKYESPKGRPNRAFVPPGTRAALSDPSAPLGLTEGEKKAAAADQHGFPCVGLTGVYGWQAKRAVGPSDGPAGPRELIPDLSDIAWAGRRVFVVFDSDAAANPQVRAAERHLAQTLRRRGAVVTVVRLPAGPDGAKVGLDDFLLSGGPEAFRKLLAERITEEPTARDFGAALFRDDAELDRLAGLKADDPAAFAAERAALKRRGVSLRDLDHALSTRPGMRIMFHAPHLAH